MPEAKKAMLQARLQKRLRFLGISSFDEYYDYVFSSPSASSANEELQQMIDVVTTNKTDFFRESQHFDYLVHQVLPKYIQKDWLRYEAPQILGEDRPSKKVIMAWSVGCSSGEEPYTLSMVLNDFVEYRPSLTYSILATDISTKMLKKAKLGIYDHERVEPVPMSMRKKYLLKSKDEAKGLVRIVPKLRMMITFKRINLMENSFYIRDQMDIIFFRNVLIYFDRPTQEAVLNRLCRCLRPEGYMFLGHSETLNGLDVPLIPKATSVYKRI